MDGTLAFGKLHSSSVTCTVFSLWTLQIRHTQTLVPMDGALVVPKDCEWDSFIDYSDF